ncbi:protein of unknown function [Candidatus Nitrospira inopinata]|uniref:Uncharacterized protein n=1 Tax=Candidatus Nitrospira inopinata TaxID=1715989 RepID=A0A0S4KV52_9BACT|nr:protein of unknown function [Candidatus Nitrospira inopinata]
MQKTFPRSKPSPRHRWSPFNTNVRRNNLRSPENTATNRGAEIESLGERLAMDEALPYHRRIRQAKDTTWAHSPPLPFPTSIRFFSNSARCNSAGTA